MIYFFYGEDTYRSREKLRELIVEYQQKAGSALNVYRFDAEEGGADEFEQMLRGGSLFQEKRLVVAEHIFSQADAYEILLRSAENLARSRSNIIFLWERELDKAAVERLKKLAPHITKTQEFKRLRGDEVTRWVYREASKRSIRLGAADCTHLISLSNDLWALSGELDKFVVSSQPTTHHSHPTTSVFHLGDTFFSSPRDALRHLLSLFSQGEDEFGVFSYLANHARTLLVVRSYADEQKPVAAYHGIHPFVIKKASAIVRMLPASHFYLSLRNFFEEDWRIKTGISGPKESLFRLLLGSSEAYR